MLNIKNLRFSYPNSAFTLTINDLTFKPGEISALIGGNGCGKTTLFRLLSGVYQPEVPCFSFNGVPKTAHSKLDCNIVMHNSYGGISPRLTVLQNAQFVARLYGCNSSKQHITQLAKSIDISEYLEAKSDQLSAGQSQKAMLLRTLASSPDIVLLDEPTTALDVIGIETTLLWINALSKAGKTVIVSTHHLYELGMMQPHVIGLRDGKIVCDITNKEDISSPKKARELIHSIIGTSHEY
jgi:ABC-type multidrug transport system ATPase subunit|tara:strand:- start:23222 stop:23938 length:717 start_codon:yes stop_codon:yes gene_type:complete